ncbi:unnamed protein product [Fraxinus pennsylvanica]|uniref:Uncharacterized protein n=1 Tax=Fraxinus pennsylvanica TaxID=56036 RepID=A0AAD2EDZ0_9LAMI|nr:unnamed protein product [Fraxinus pennsylvanica]
MDLRLHGLLLSTTQRAPKVSVSSSFSRIRAPLTMHDSNFEYFVSVKSHKNSSVTSYSSGSEAEYEGFVSGEDEFESASKRHLESNLDEEVLEETHFVEPSVKNPDGEIVQRSDDLNEFAFRDNGVIEFLEEVDNLLLHDENKRVVVTEHRLPSTSFAGGQSSRDHSQEIDRHDMTDSDEEVNSDREIDGFSVKRW